MADEPSLDLSVIEPPRSIDKLARFLENLTSAHAPTYQPDSLLSPRIGRAGAMAQQFSLGIGSNTSIYRTGGSMGPMAKLMESYSISVLEIQDFTKWLVKWQERQEAIEVFATETYMRASQRASDETHQTDVAPASPSMDLAMPPVAVPPHGEEDDETQKSSNARDRKSAGKSADNLEPDAPLKASAPGEPKSQPTPLKPEKLPLASPEPEVPLKKIESNKILDKFNQRLWTGNLAAVSFFAGLISERSDSMTALASTSGRSTPLAGQPLYPGSGLAQPLPLATPPDVTISAEPFRQPTFPPRWQPSQNGRANMPPERPSFEDGSTSQSSPGDQFIPDQTPRQDQPRTSSPIDSPSSSRQSPLDRQFQQWPTTPPSTPVETTTSPTSIEPAVAGSQQPLVAGDSPLKPTISPFLGVSIADWTSALASSMPFMALGLAVPALSYFFQQIGSGKPDSPAVVPSTQETAQAPPDTASLTSPVAPASLVPSAQDAPGTPSFVQPTMPLLAVDAATQALGATTNKPNSVDPMLSVAQPTMPLLAVDAATQALGATTNRSGAGNLAFPFAQTVPEFGTGFVQDEKQASDPLRRSEFERRVPAISEGFDREVVTETGRYRQWSPPSAASGSFGIMPTLALNAAGEALDAYHRFPGESSPIQEPEPYLGPHSVAKDLSFAQPFHAPDIPEGSDLSDSPLSRVRTQPWKTDDAVRNGASRTLDSGALWQSEHERNDFRYPNAKALIGSNQRPMTGLSQVPPTVDLVEWLGIRTKALQLPSKLPFSSGKSKTSDLDPTLGQVTLVAPPVAVASPEATASGSAVQFDLRALAAGSGGLDAATMSAISASMPGVRAIYPAIPTQNLGPSAVNLQLDKSLLTKLIGHSYGADPKTSSHIASSIPRLGGMGTPSIGPLRGSIVPKGHPRSNSASVLPDDPSNPLGTLGLAGQGQAKRGGPLGFLGMPIRLAPSLTGRPQLTDEIDARTPAVSKDGGTIRPARFNALRSKMFPGFGSVTAEPDQHSWRKAAPSFGLRNALPTTLLSPDSRLKPAPPSAPKAQSESGVPSLPTRLAPRSPLASPMTAPTRSGSGNARPFVPPNSGRSPLIPRMPLENGIGKAPAMQFPQASLMSRPGHRAPTSTAGIGTGFPHPLARSVGTTNPIGFKGFGSGHHPQIGSTHTNGHPISSPVVHSKAPAAAKKSIVRPPLIGSTARHSQRSNDQNPYAIPPQTGRSTPTMTYSRSKAAKPAKEHVMLQRSVGGGSMPAIPAAKMGQKQSEAPQGEGDGASELNAMAQEVWSLLKRRLSVEADRRGRW